MRQYSVFQIDISVIRTTYVPSTDGIYKKVMSVDSDDRALSPIETIFGAEWSEELPEYILEIGSLQIDNELYLSVDSYDELYLFDKAHYFDYDTQTHYIALPNWRNTLPSDVYKTGETTGFLNQAQMAEIAGVRYPIDIEYRGAYYEPRLNDVSTEENTDNQEAGKFVFPELSASIDNSDGAYDNLRRDATGNSARLYVANLADSQGEEIETGFPYKLKAEPEDFNLVQSGVIEDIDYSNPNNPRIIAFDPRFDWTQKIGQNLMTVSEYPDLTDKYIDSRKPILIGSVNGASCIPLQDTNDIAADFDYLICDTSLGEIQSISDIYFDGQLHSGGEKIDVDRYLTGSEYSVDLSTGILTIANCYKGKAYAYGVFTETDELVEVVTYLLDEYAGIKYIDNFYNLDEVGIIKALDYKVHVYIDEKGKELNKIIESLIMGARIDFFQQGDVFTMRRTDELREATEYIQTYQLESTPAPWTNSRGKTFKTIEVLYNTDYREKLSDRYYDDSRESEALENNRKAEDKTETVLLTNASQVADIYDDFYSRFVKLPRTVTINLMKPFTAGLTDFVELTIVRRNMAGDTEIFPQARYKIVDINRINNTAKVEYFEDTDIIYDIIVAWSATPTDIYEWSATPTIILEA